MHKSHTWEKTGSWDISQNALGQSDCRVFKLALEQHDEKHDFLHVDTDSWKLKVNWKILG